MLGWMRAAVMLLVLPVGGTASAAPKEPPILRQWQPKPAVVANMLPHGTPIRGIVIHNTETPQAAWRSKTTAQKMRDIQAYHLTRPHKYRANMQGKTWGDFAYHYYIDVGGQIAKGRDDQYQGDSGTRYDLAGRLLIVLEGKFDVEQPTREQLASLDALVQWLAAKHGLKADSISSHNDHAPTTCPGKNLKSYVPELRDKTAKALAAN